jgi:hypothetical protein
LIGKLYEVRKIKLYKEGDMFWKATAQTDTLIPELKK